MHYSSSPVSSLWQSLPHTPGVYIYKNTAGEILYVGKAVDLKNRVSSYFRSPKDLGAKTRLLVENIATVDYIEVNSEIEALLLESRLIHKWKPHFNIASKDDKSPYYIHLTHEEFPRPVLTHNSRGAVVGPFLNSRVPRKILGEFRRIAPYCTSPRPVRKPCFYSHLGLCSPCPGSASPALKSDYLKNISRLKNLLNGHIQSVRTALKKDMLSAAKAHNFEAAAQVRNQLQTLDHLTSQPVMPDEYLANPNLIQDKRQAVLDSIHQLLQPHIKGLSSLSRIEFYDNAHLAGDAATSAMVVAVDGQIAPSQYRHFTIRTSKSDSDVDMMREVLSRRLKHLDWPQPDLIILDGGKPQLNAVPDTNIPVIALAKREETLVVPVDSGYIEFNPALDHPGMRLLLTLRDEAHRFSRRLHHAHRRKNLLN